MGSCVTRSKQIEPISTSSRERWKNEAKIEQVYSRVTDGGLDKRAVYVNQFIKERYEIFTSIGKGEFGHVVRAQDKHNKMPYAIKVIELTPDIRAKSKVELQILRKVNHKYVIRLYEVYATTRRLYLVMDLATGGELMDRISLLGNFNERDASHVLYMILDGLRYLHSNGITHRDLKPQNILYYHPGSNSRIIITDFGLSAMSDSSQNPANYLMKTDCGTVEYMAPEVITRAHYTNAVDMWSMGVIAYIVLSGRLPFPLNGNILSTLRMICFCKYSFEEEPWNAVSDEAKTFIRSLLVVEPAKRLTAAQALKHRWIRRKTHNKQNLQKSISSNWNDSRTSLKNEKGLKCQAREILQKSKPRTSHRSSTNTARLHRKPLDSISWARSPEGHTKDRKSKVRSHVSRKGSNKKHQEKKIRRSTRTSRSKISNVRYTKGFKLLKEAGKGIARN
ncbi:serine/threonine-protein kinase H1-like [Xenia sp. Carnegie-2017]|uniref:serine/threonine-protein kinase H1-like n=1 Tax=Xenia sp. Carnegie-2017 TaxID=2897299 RepID=UPI001F03E751|nr:serine/threonine-protein kinase H1-like [Xenia sp. Carnegie-2017]